MKTCPPGEWFKLYYRRFFRSPRVLAMTASQKCLYLAALCLQFEEGRLPTDTRTLQTLLAGCWDGAWEDNWPTVQACFDEGQNAVMHEVRQAAIDRRSVRSDAGKAGRHKQLSNRRANARANAQANGANRRAHAGQRRGEERREETPYGGAGGAGAPRAARSPSGEVLEAWIQEHRPFDRPDFRQAWADFEAHRASLPRRDQLSDVGRRKALAKLAPWGPDKAIRALNESVVSAWRGVFEPKGEAPKANETPGRERRYHEAEKEPASRLTDDDWDAALAPIRAFREKALNGNHATQETP